MRETRKMPEAEFSFGTVSTEVKVEGDFDNLPQVADHVAALCHTTATLECVRFGSASPNSSWSEGNTDETIHVTTTVEDMALDVTFNFRLHRQVPRQTLQSVIAGRIMPIALQTLGHYADTDSHLVPAPSASWSGDTTSRLIEQIDTLTQADASDMPSRARHAQRTTG
jgi:hypothetical protein